MVPGSRSPSPSSSALKRNHKLNGAIPSETFSHTPRSLSSSTLDTKDNSKSPKYLRRRLSTYLGKGSPNSATPSVPALPRSFSTDKFFTVKDRAPRKPSSTPQTISSERLQGSGIEASRKKDELSGAFRALDADFQKHVSPATA